MFWLTPHSNLLGIDVLLGVDLYPQSVLHESPGFNKPYVWKPAFYYIVMGHTHCLPDVCLTTECSLSCQLATWISIPPSSISELPPHSKHTAEEQFCNQHFASIHSWTIDSRYIFCLPFKLLARHTNILNDIFSQRILNFSSQAQLMDFVSNSCTTTKNPLI